MQHVYKNDNNLKREYEVTRPFYLKTTGFKCNDCQMRSYTNMKINSFTSKKEIEKKIKGKTTFHRKTTPITII